MAKITISYRREDSMDITGRIFDRLTSRYGRETVFRDIDNIPPGIDFRTHIRDSIHDSDVLMVVVGPRWVGGARRGQPRIQSETDYVRVEVEAALNRDIPVIPLLVGGAQMPEPSELPDSIREFAFRNAVHVDSGRDFDHHMNGLIRATDAILLAKMPASGVSGQNPDRDRVPAAAPIEVKTTPGGASRQQLFLPIVGGAMTVVGLMEIAWFTTSLLSALSNDNVRMLFQEVWVYADMSFGFGGLVFGLSIIRGAHWGRLGGIILCLLMVFSNLLWFITYYDQELPRLVLFGTGFASMLAAVGVYLLLMHWPQPREQA